MSTTLIILASIILADWVLFEGTLTQLLWYIVMFFVTVTIFYFIGKSAYIAIVQAWA